MTENESVDELLAPNLKDKQLNLPWLIFIQLALCILWGSKHEAFDNQITQSD